MALKTSVLAVALAAVLVGLATRLPPLPRQAAPEAHTCDVDVDGPAVAHLARMLSFRTLGSADEPDSIKPGHHDQFQAFHDFMEASYPEVYSTLEVEKVGAGNWTLLFTWKGSDPSLNPVLFVSHYDVVPVAEGTEGEWKHGPFDGKVVDGVIWGRGALDIKYTVAAVMEAFTGLIKAGFSPKRTMIACWGHDEELGGSGGASQVAKLLEERGVKLDIIFDEGGAVLIDGMGPLAPYPVAMVATAEKMYTSIEVTVRSGGGHSSMPPLGGQDVGAQMGKVLSYIASHQPPVELRQPMVDFLQSLAPYQPIPLLQRLMYYANTWPLRQLWALLMSYTGASNNAMVRATVAATRVAAGVADNVLPITGTVGFNIRSHPSTKRQELLDYFAHAINKTGLAASASARVTEMSFQGPPGKVTPTAGRHFRLLKQAVQEYWRLGPDGQAVAVVPYLVSGNTDSKHYAGLSQGGVLRISFYQMNRTAGDLGSIHGTDERVRAADLPLAVCTYKRLITLLAEP